MYKVPDDLMDEVRHLLFVARHAAAKLDSEYTRRSICRSSEWDELILVKDRLMKAGIELGKLNH